MCAFAIDQMAWTVTQVMEGLWPLIVVLPGWVYFYHFNVRHHERIKELETKMNLPYPPLPTSIWIATLALWGLAVFEWLQPWLPG